MVNPRAEAPKAQSKHLTVQESRKVLKEMTGISKEYRNTGAILKVLPTGQS